MSAYFIVRAQVADMAVKDAFDRWYQNEHLPDAVKGFNAKRGSRGWSCVDPSTHYAIYEFDNLASALAIQNCAEFRRLVAEFDRAWGAKVTRSRDFVEVVQGIVA